VPEGAQVYLDGNAQAGRAPLKLEIAMGLQHDLRVEADGHAPQTRAVRYANAGPHTETFTLLPIQKGMGVVKIVSDPPGAKVFLDGRELAERTPTMVGQVIAGEDHVLLTSLAGYEDARQTVRVKEREVQEVSFKLAAIPGAAPAPTPAPPVSPGVKPAPTAALAATPALGPGQLTVRTRPSVLLSVDGRALGRTPIEKLDLPPGRHELRFQDEDSFLDQKVFVEVAPGKESVDDRAFAKRRVRFAPQPWANVYVKDRFLLTAPGDKDLYPGTYSVTFVNDKIKARKTIQIIVPDAGADLATMTVKLTPGEGWDGG
jgi:hypothetical protein